MAKKAQYIDGQYQMPISISHMRLPADNKNYWLNQLQVFANQFAEYAVKSVNYGKMDIRGTVSITLFDHNHCVPRQLHFATRDALLGYVQGRNDAVAGYYDQFDQWLPTRALQVAK